MTGWKTLIFGALLAIGVPLTDFLGAVHWTDLGLSPTAAALIGAAVVALRAATKTPIGTKG